MGSRRTLPSTAADPAPRPAVSRSQVLVAATTCAATVVGAAVVLPVPLWPGGRDTVTAAAASRTETSPAGGRTTTPRPPAALMTSPPSPKATGPLVTTAGDAPDTATGVRTGTARGGAPRAARIRTMSARPGAGRLVVSWSVEAPDGAPLRTTVSGPDGAAAGQCPPTPTGCTVSGLTPGLDHTVTLTVGGTRGSASAVPYPAVLDGAATRLWFDPSAPGGLGPRPPAAGQPVRRVDDRSRFGADAVGADGFAAPSVTTLSGHRALRFRTGSGLAFPPGSLPTGGEPATVYVVAVNADANPEQECFALALSWGSVGRGGSRLVTKGCGTSLAFADTYDTWADQTPTRRWLSGRTHVVRADFTPAEFSVWMDGAFSYRWPTTPDALRTRSHPTGMLGAAFWDTGSSWRGVIGEVVVLSGTPTAAEDRAITDYLTRKWTS